MKEETRDAVETLADRGKRYIKTRDVAAELGIESSGKMGHIGCILNDLEITEEWTRGSTSKTYRIVEGEEKQ